MLSSGLVQTRSRQTLQRALYELVGQYSTNWPALTAALTVTAVPILVCLFLLDESRFRAHRRLRERVTQRFPNHVETKQSGVVPSNGPGLRAFRPSR